MPSAEGERGESFRRIGERPRFEGSFFSAVTATFVGPDGFAFEREIVRHPGAVCAVPLEADGCNVLMVRQYRAAVEEYVLELPAGKQDKPGEDAAAAIARELAEEIGRQAGQITEIGRFYNSPGYANEETICYLASELVECERKPQRFEEENMTLERVRLDEVEELMAAGDLRDGKSIVALFAARAVLSAASRPLAP